MRHRIAEIAQHAITEILRQIALKALQHLSTDLVIGAHHLAVILRVQPSRQGWRPPRSQKSTVRWRRSASGGGAAAASETTADSGQGCEGSSETNAAAGSPPAGGAGATARGAGTAPAGGGADVSAMVTGPTKR